MARVREGEADWHAFTDLPGTRASWRAADGRKELTSTDGQVLATLWPRIELTVEGRTYEVRGNGKRITRFRVPCDLVNAETGQQMLRIEREPEGRRIFGTIETPSHRYTFPVRGERQRFATMSAVDEGGNAVIHYREVPGRRHILETVREMEIVISPEQPISDELCCILWASRGFLWFYFNHNYPH